jgi:hypothetical protein
LGLVGYDYDMKKFVLILLFVLGVANDSLAQISINSYYDGYWGSWRNTSGCSIRGNYSGFIIYASKDHPSQYFFKFQITNYSTPDTNTLKYCRKNNEWLKYSGIVEYFVSESYPTIADVLKKNHFPSKFDSSKEPVAKRTTNATIKIAPYKNHPKVYNIWFDGIGVGIDLNDMSFKQ